MREVDVRPWGTGAAGAIHAHQLLGIPSLFANLGSGTLDCYGGDCVPRAQSTLQAKDSVWAIAPAS